MNSRVHYGEKRPSFSGGCPLVFGSVTCDFDFFLIFLVLRFSLPNRCVIVALLGCEEKFWDDAGCCFSSRRSSLLRRFRPYYDFFCEFL